MVTSTPAYAPPLQTLQKILDKAFSGVHHTPTSLSTLPASSYNTLYRLTLSASPTTSQRTYILKLSPPPELRLLRHETSLTAAEATVLSLLRRTNLPLQSLELADESCVLLPTPYLLLSHLPGTPLSVLRPGISHSQSARIDYILGQHLSSLSATTSHAFGRVQADAKKYSTWKESFLALTEGILRDGEDMMVFLPYEQLRSQFRRLSFTMEEIATPRLAILDFGDANVLVDAAGDVSGLVGLERAVWADPAFSAVFFKAPSEEFLRGYVAGGGGARIGGKWRECRRLLYRCYYSTIKIVESYYYHFDSESEMKERRNLAKDLETLSRFNVKGSQ
ncbi:hypothetical protein RUND412_001429 [Rhizina undulata]